MKSFKGFNEDMTCRNFQYEVGGDYEETYAKICRRGFHACKYPTDVFNHYSPSTSVYHRVEQSGALSEQTDSQSSKVASTKIHIGERISITDIVEESIKLTAENNKPIKSTLDFETVSSERDKTVVFSGGLRSVASESGVKGVAYSDGGIGAAISTGNGGVTYSDARYCISASTGDCSASCAESENSIACTSGDYSATEVNGLKGVSCSSGDECLSSSTGIKNISAVTGEASKASTTGNLSAAVTVGYNGSAFAGHNSSVAVAWGECSCASGVIGATLVLSEWDSIGIYPSLKSFKAVTVDGKTIKENIYYTLHNGEVVEVN